MSKYANLLILPAFLACMGWAVSANAGVCFVVGGDCGELNSIMQIKDCSGLGYKWTLENCRPENHLKLDGGQCKDKDGVIRHEKCVCDTTQFIYDMRESDAAKYEYHEKCEYGDYWRKRTCKRDYKYPGGMTASTGPNSSSDTTTITISQYGDTCTDGYGTRSKDYICPSSYEKTGDNQGGFIVKSTSGSTYISEKNPHEVTYTATCYKPKTCATYGAEWKDHKPGSSNAEDGFREASHDTKSVGENGSTRDATCYKWRDAVCADYDLKENSEDCGNSYVNGSNQSVQSGSGSNTRTCHGCVYNPCPESDYPDSSCEHTFCVKSGECYRKAVCSDIKARLNGGTYNGDVNLSSSSTQQSGYTVPSSTYAGTNVTYYARDGKDITNIDSAGFSITGSSPFSLKVNDQTCYWARTKTCSDYGQNYYNSMGDCAPVVANGGYKCVIASGTEVGGLSGCYKKVAKTCSDYGYVAPSSSGYTASCNSGKNIKPRYGTVLLGDEQVECVECVFKLCEDFAYSGTDHFSTSPTGLCNYPGGWIKITDMNYIGTHLSECWCCGTNNCPTGGGATCKQTRFNCQQSDFNNTLMITEQSTSHSVSCNFTYSSNSSEQYHISCTNGSSSCKFRVDGTSHTTSAIVGCGNHTITKE